MYSVIVSFGVIVSFRFSVFIVKGIFGVRATSYVMRKGIFGVHATGTHMTYLLDSRSYGSARANLTA